MLWYVLENERGLGFAKLLKENNIDYSFFQSDKDTYVFKKTKDDFIVIANYDVIQDLISKNHFLSKGVFFDNDNFSVKSWNDNRKKQMLNHDGDLVFVNQVEENIKSYVDFFYRPFINNKIFEAGIYSFNAFKEILITLKENNINFFYQSPIKNIIKEYRACFINGKIVDLVVYKNWVQEDDLSLEWSVEKIIYQALEKGWLPNKNCIMDIARLNNGSVKIIEFNSINCCDLSILNLQNINDALNV